MKIHKMLTKNSKCYDSTHKRTYGSVRYIVIHYTGNKGDTAKGNCNYFKNGSLTRNAGAHFFVDSKQVWKSVPIDRIAYAVGAAAAETWDGGGSLFGKCTNANSVSIELCDCLTGASKSQIKLTKKLIKKIGKKCKNAKTICRHWDVTGKTCPAPYIGKDNKKWKALVREIS